jgi:peptide methionine sulfoxide reductase MsrB
VVAGLEGGLPQRLQQVPVIRKTCQAIRKAAYVAHTHEVTVFTITDGFDVTAGDACYYRHNALSHCLQQCDRQPLMVRQEEEDIQCLEVLPHLFGSQPAEEVHMT